MRKLLLTLSYLTPPVLYLLFRPVEWWWSWSIPVLLVTILVTEQIDNFFYRKSMNAK